MESNGTFNIPFYAPSTSSGSHIIEATDGTNVIKYSFVLEDTPGPIDFGVGRSFVYVSTPRTVVLAVNPGGHVLLAVHPAGQGRSVYLAGLPYSPENSRLLHRAIFWAARHEDRLRHWFSTHPATDCAAFPDTGYFTVASVAGTAVETTVYDGRGEPAQVVLEPHEIKWFRNA